MASGRLVVSTTDGNVRCYSAGPPPAEVERVGFSVQQGESPFVDDERLSLARKMAAKICSIRPFSEGHALIVGGDGRMAWELAKQTNLTIQVMAKRRDDLADIRSRLASSGLYGHRITVTAAESRQLPFAPYLFNLVVDSNGIFNREAKDAGQ